jgi:hypothetical protein
MRRLRRILYMPLAAVLVAVDVARDPAAFFDLMKEAPNGQPPTSRPDRQRSGFANEENG